MTTIPGFLIWNSTHRFAYAAEPRRAYFDALPNVTQCFDPGQEWLSLVDRVTAQQFAERDPEGEIGQWLTAIAELVAGAS